MKNIFVISAGILLAALLPEAGVAQTMRDSPEPAISAVGTHPNDVVQPIPKPTRTETIAPAVTEPVYLHSGQNPPPNVTRPLEPLPQPSIDRLYNNRMNVDNFTPETPQTPVLAPPPANMTPDKAPNRPGNIGGTTK